jgi:uncharacterized repeat protein (TIGR03803 family)
MKLLRPSRATAVIGAVGILVGCGGSQASINMPNTIMQGRANVPLNAYLSLYSFAGGRDGKGPEAKLLLHDGLLYGTTGAGGERCLGTGCGTVFKITTSGVEGVVHRFQGLPNDGAEPLAGLTPLGPDLYGTTYLGGTHCGRRKVSNGCGSVFKINASGVEQVVYRFKGFPDGANPEGPITVVGNNLYGTTTAGGSKCRFKVGCGTVFVVTPAGKERVLYRFQDEPDGSEPTGNLVSLNGVLYGTTYSGGAYGSGTIFAVSTSGSEHVVYSSGQNGFPDMESPSGLEAMNGVLYGSSSNGGPQNGGTVYSVTTTGDEHVVRHFSDNIERNGNRPYGKLLAIDGVLFGSTYDGGQEYGGSGILFSLTPAGAFKVLYRFRGVPDGSSPFAGLTDVKGALYGTTYAGGTNNDGTVFRFSPKN